MISGNQKLIASIVLGFFLASQLLTFTAVLMIPKKAEAWGPSITVADIPRILEKVALGVLRSIATKISQKFLNRFVAKLTEKYKIKNYLYYDRVLSNYYLNRFISDKVSDPDLRQIYTLLERGFITGQSTGTTGGPDPAKALIPQIAAAINKRYEEQGGINKNRVYDRGSFKSDREYFAAVRAHYRYPKAAVEQTVREGFGSAQSNASMAAQIEVLIGNGIKAGRIIGGTCSKKDIVNPTPESCKAAGGVWNPSALDKARSFIDNPTQFVISNLDSFIKEHVKANFDPNNY